LEKTRINMKDSSRTSARNRLDAELLPSGSSAADAAFEPEFIDMTEDNHALIISGVWDDENMEQKAPGRESGSSAASMKTISPLRSS
jgi:hypothetical protein